MKRVLGLVLGVVWGGVGCHPANEDDDSIEAPDDDSTAPLDDDSTMASDDDSAISADNDSAADDDSSSVKEELYVEEYLCEGVGDYEFSFIYQAEPGTTVSNLTIWGHTNEAYDEWVATTDWEYWKLYLGPLEDPPAWYAWTEFTTDEEGYLLMACTTHPYGSLVDPPFSGYVIDRFVLVVGG